jgi:phosphonopyruvate decarboxylase
MAGESKIDCLKALEALGARRTDEIVVATMMPAREWPNYSRAADLDIPFIGCMGKASSLGLGIALGRPDRRVLVLDGDGSLLMNLGSLVTIANASPKNLVHVVFENGVYEVTGSQPVPGDGRCSFAAIARGAGIARVYEFDALEPFEEALEEILSGEGPTFVCLKVTEIGRLAPKPPRTMGQAAREIRELLAGAAVG